MARLSDWCVGVGIGDGLFGPVLTFLDRDGKEIVPNMEQAGDIAAALNAALTAEREKGK